MGKTINKSFQNTLQCIACELFQSNVTVKFSDKFNFVVPLKECSKQFTVPEKSVLKVFKDVFC